MDEEFDLLGVNAHATSTPKGDKAEVLAVTKFLQSEAMPENLAIGPTLFLTSHKGNIGHLLGGAGSTGEHRITYSDIFQTLLKL